jgi:hypothetical protein
VNQELTPSDIEGWESPTAVRESFSDLGLDPDSISWFSIETTTADCISEIDIEFTRNLRCILVLHESLEFAWLVGFVSRPIGTPSVRYHRFDPSAITNSKTELRETLDRLNALDPDSPQSTANALSKSDLNDQFSNTVSVLYEEVYKNVKNTFGLSEQRANDFSSSLLITALRAKILAEYPGQPNKSFQQLLMVPLKELFSTEGSWNTPETLQPIYEAAISNEPRSLTTASNSAVQKEFLNSFISSFKEHFRKFDWLLSDTAWSSLDQVTAHTIGLALERYLTDKHGEEYHTPPELTNSIAQETISDAIIDQLNSSVDGTYTDLSEVLGRSVESLHGPHFNHSDNSVLDQNIAAKLSNDVLPELRVVDPATGSGTFLLSALDTIVKIRNYVESAQDISNTFEQYEYPDLLQNQTHRGFSVWTSISQNLYGVDLDPEAVSLTRFRLELVYLCTLGSQDEFVDLRFGHNLKCGNSIIGKPYSSDPPYWSGQLPLSVFQKNGEPYTDYPQGSDSSDTLACEVRPLLSQYRTVPSSDSQGTLNSIIDIISDRNGEINARLRFELYEKGTEDRGPESGRQEQLSQRDAFHWPIEFPCVMDEGGFDVVLFHSPWSKSNIRHSLDKSTRNYLYSGFQYQLPPSKGWRRTSDTIDSFFLHRAHDIINEGGMIAALVDESVLTTPSSHHVRARYLTTTNIDRVANFTNQNTFDQIDRRFKYAVLVSQASQQTETINIGSGFITPENYTDSGQYYEINRNFITRFSPNTLSFPQIERDIQLEALELILASPTISDEEMSDGWTIHPTGEFNQTSDSEYISESRFENSDPIYRGANIYQYIYQTAPEAAVDKPDLWTIPREAERGMPTRQYLRERKRTSDTDTLPAESSRIVYRRITNSANERSMIACLLPPDHFHINSLNSINPHQGDQTNIERRLVLLGLLNSIPYDYLLRQKITNSIPKYTLFETRIPFITGEHPLFEQILRRVGRLNLIGVPFEAQQEELGIQPAKESEERRRRLRAEIDAAAFDLYGFEDVDVIERVLDDFGFVRNPRVMDSDYYDLVLEAFEQGEYRNDP